MIQGGVSQYLEFKPVVTGIMWTESGFRQLPCNKSEIFKDQHLTLREKRSLMRFIEAVPEIARSEEEFNGVLDTFELSETLRNVIQYGLLYRAESNESMTTAKAVERITVDSR